ncbi:hypothetical protein KUCAC02_016888 [Chaenocephalus aceratus]|nr:hypothetical protein KUCAC02_016888 [Chaenocephalus aceratus]
MQPFNISTHLIGRTEARDVGRAPGCRNVWSSDKKADDNKMFSLFPHVWREARHPSEAPDHYTVDGRVEDVVGQETLTEDTLHLGDTLKEARENVTRAQEKPRQRLKSEGRPFLRLATKFGEGDKLEANCLVSERFSRLKEVCVHHIILRPMAGGEDERCHAESTHLIGRTEARDVGRAPGCSHVWREARHPSEAPDHCMVDGRVEDVVGQETLTEDILHLGDTLKEARENVTRAQEKTRQRLKSEGRPFLRLATKFGEGGKLEATCLGPFTIKSLQGERALIHKRRLPQDLQQLRAPRSRLYLRKARHVYTPAWNALQARVVEDASGNGSHVLGSKIGPYKMYYWDIKQIGPDMELESESRTPTGRTPEDRDSNRENPRGQRATFNDTSRLKIDPLDYAVILGIVNDHHLWTLTHPDGTSWVLAFKVSSTTSEKADRPAESRHHKGCRLLAREDNRKAVHKQSDKPSSKCRKHREEYIQAMRGDKQARELEAVPLSDGTISRRITDMAQDIKYAYYDPRGEILAGPSTVHELLQRLPTPVLRLWFVLSTKHCEVKSHREPLPPCSSP